MGTGALDDAARPRTPPLGPCAAGFFSGRAAANAGRSALDADARGRRRGSRAGARPVAAPRRALPARGSGALAPPAGAARGPLRAPRPGRPGGAEREAGWLAARLWARGGARPMHVTVTGSSPGRRVLPPRRAPAPLLAETARLRHCWRGLRACATAGIGLARPRHFWPTAWAGINCARAPRHPISPFATPQCTAKQPACDAPRPPDGDARASSARPGVILGLASPLLGGAALPRCTPSRAPAVSEPAPASQPSAREGPVRVEAAAAGRRRHRKASASRRRRAAAAAELSPVNGLLARSADTPPPPPRTR